MEKLLQWLTPLLLAMSILALNQTPLSQPSYDLTQLLISNDDSVFENSLYSLHRSLVDIESISGNERAVGIFLESYLQSHNYTVERQYVDIEPTTSSFPPMPFPESQRNKFRIGEQRFNILAYPGSLRQTHVLLTSHLDTVPPFHPYSLDSNLTIWGRGSVDAKACVATQFTALQELLSAHEISEDDVSLLFVVGEETGGQGMRTVNELGLEWETVIFGEPTELKLAAGHKGIVIFTLRARGQAGHSGYPWLGKSANHMLVSALAKLQAMELPWSDKYGNSTLNVGKIGGGVAANVIAEIASADIGIRVADGDPQHIQKLVLEVVEAVDQDLEVEFWKAAYGPQDIDADVAGFETVIVNYGTDIPNLRGKHRRHLYGPGSILEAHSAHEHLAAGGLTRAVEGYKRLILEALGSRRRGGSI